MSDKAVIADDGRLLCAHCDNSELRYHILHHRKDVHRARFDAKSNQLYIVEEPVDGDTLEVYDEYLHCPHCGGCHDIPMDEDDDCPEYENVSHEGDFHRARKPETSPGECPLCGSAEVKLVEDVQVSRFVRESEEHVIRTFGNHDIEWDTVTNTRLWCRKCYCEWSVPHDVDIED